MTVAMMIELRRPSQKFTDAPEPPWACASVDGGEPEHPLECAPGEVDRQQRARCRWPARCLVENAVRIIQ